MRKECKRKREREGRTSEQVQSSDRALLSSKGVNKEHFPSRHFWFTTQTPHTGEVSVAVKQPSEKIVSTVGYNDPWSLSEEMNPLISSKGRFVRDSVPGTQWNRRD